MTVYNTEKYLAEAIDSVITQTFQDFEFIIVDDGSTDSTPEIIKQYERKDSRILAVYNTDNLGIPKAANIDLSIAKGVFIARLDADDVCQPSRLEKQSTYLSDHPEIGVLGSSFETIDENGMRIDIIQLARNNILLKWDLCFRNPIAHSTVMMRRILLKNELYNKEIKYSQDYDLWTRLIWITKLKILPEVLVKLRKHPLNISNKYQAEQLSNALTIRQLMIFKVLDEKVPIHKIKQMINKTFNSTQDLHNSLTIIFHLYKHFKMMGIKQRDLSYIKNDAINQIMIICKNRFPHLDFIFGLFFVIRIDLFLFLSTYSKKLFKPFFQ